MCVIILLNCKDSKAPPFDCCIIDTRRGKLNNLFSVTVNFNLQCLISFVQITSRFCPHHVGHYLGMDVHDTPRISRSDQLQAGMVITIEPGKMYATATLYIYMNTMSKTVAVPCINISGSKKGDRHFSMRGNILKKYQF